MLFRLVSCVASANLFRPVSRWLCFVSPPILHPPLCFGCRRHCTIGPSNLWNRAKMPPNMNFGGRSSRKRYYAVYRGKDGFQGVLSDWNSCKSKVHAVPGAVYKSFKTRAEAALFAATGVSSPARVVEKSTQEDPAQRLSAASKSGQDEAIKDVVRCNDEFTEVGFVSESTLTNPDIKAVDGRNLVVFTDGACTRNGRHGACAGVGVYFPPPFSNLSISERLRGAEQTNQRAEQTAVLLAIRTCLNNHLIARGDCLTIKTDSKYTLTGMLDWIHKWKKNGFKTSTGLSVKNMDLWLALEEAQSEAKSKGIVLKVEWVRGHDGEYGNEQADRLAVNGANKGSEPKD